MEPYRPVKYDMPGYAELSKNRQHKKRLIKRAIFILTIPIVALMFTAFFLRIYHVQGPSMEPNLKDNQRVLIEKWSKTVASLKGNRYKPSRYDIVVLKPPDDNTQVIKRVIGMPGDRVIVDSSGIVIINSQHPDGYEVDKESPVSNLKYKEETTGNVDITLSGDQYFVLGDNRQASEDSRLFGPITSDDIVGKLWQKL